MVLIALAVASISTTITKSKLFYDFREWSCSIFLRKLKPDEMIPETHLCELVQCPYCLSHWVTFFFVTVYYIYDGVWNTWHPLVEVFAIITVASFAIWGLLKAIVMMERFEDN
jgi:hypothetical protein